MTLSLEIEQQEVGRGVPRFPGCLGRWLRFPRRKMPGRKCRLWFFESSPTGIEHGEVRTGLPEISFEAA
jgi:hypothetical protein